MLFTKENFKKYKDINGIPYQEQFYNTQTDQILGGTQSIILSFPHALQEVRNHFDCPTLDGVYLENEGSEQNRYRYLEKGLFFNEISTYQIQDQTGDILYQKPVFSRITTALILDSNLYAYINEQLTDPLIWGKKKGCQFINQQKNNYLGNLSGEFCLADNEIGIQESQFGKGYCKKDQLTNTLSFYQYQDKLDLCDIAQNQRMFMHIQSNTKTFMCYKATCELSNDIGASQLYSIQLENPLQANILYTCSKPGELIPTSNTNIVCPSDFYSFCSTLTLFCVDQCNNRGLCISGKCFCNDNYFGPSCQCEKSTSKYFSPSGNGNNPDIVCISECGVDQKLLESQNICVNNICDINDRSWINCQSCNINLTDQCQECKKGYVLVNGFCEECGIKDCANCNQNLKYKCQICKEPKSLLGNNRCVDECPYGYFSKIISDKNRVCIKCHSDCKNCTGPSEKECTICSNPLYSVFAYPQINSPSGECRVCPLDNFYVEQIERVSQICKPCNNSCQRCRGPLDTDCIQCKLDGSTNAQQKFIDQITKKCVQCPTKYYSDSIDYQCKICNNACAECVGPTEKDCLSCSQLNFYIHQTDNICRECPEIGYYKENSLCKKCHPLCKTCKGPYTNDCLSCSDGSIKSTCVQCQSGFYFDKNAQKCIACHNSCDECVGGTEYDCTKCAFKLYLRQNIQNQSLCGTCEVNKGEYTDSQYNKCMSCHSSCSTCLGSLPNQCITCKEQSFFQDPNFNLICRKCNQAQYINKDNICQNCHESCLSCKGPSEFDCLTCRNPDHSIQEKGSCGLCEQNQFKNKDNYCKQCSLNCLGCISENICTSCQSESKWKLLNYDGKCVEDCEIGTYKDIQKKMCMKCDPSCRECVGSQINECKSCNSNGALKSDKTCEYCTDNYFYKEDVNACALCNITCETCIEKSDQCILCSQGYYKNGFGRCDKVCKQNEIKVEVDSLTGEIVRRCDKCHSSCQTCFGPSQFQCVACKEQYFRVEDTNECVTACPSIGYFQDGNQCLKCQENCMRCLNLDTCNECSTSYSLFKNQTCMITCPESMYSKDKVCTNCQITCKTCTKQDVCQSCNYGYYLRLTKNSCEENCGIGEYKDTVNLKCLPCQQYCLECNGPPNFLCIKCEPGKNKRLDNTCGQCNQGEFSNNGVCQICNQQCLECSGSGADKCLSCKEGYYLSNSKCFQCTTLNCSVCQQSGGLNICKTCKSPYFLNESSQCVLTCPDFYYSDSNSRTCKKCGQNCKVCSERRGCTECQLKTQYKIRNSFECVDQCSLSEYVSDEEKKECVKKICQISYCDQCDYINQICKKCQDGYNIASQSKLCLKCKEDEYFYYQFERCVKTNEYCDSQCLTCKGPTSFDCIQCKMKYKQESQGKFYCVDTCSTDYYPDSISQTCKPCFKIEKTSNCLQKCPERTFNQNQICINCHESCQSCNGSTQTSCQTCIKNLLLWQDGSCQQYCPSNQCAIEGKCLKCQNPENPDNTSKEKSENQEYLQISSFECSDDCDKEKNFAKRIGNVEKITSIVSVCIQVINLASLNIDGFMQIQQNQQIGNLVFGQNNGKLGVGEYQLKHSFLSNIINWIPNTFLNLSENQQTQTQSLSQLRQLQQTNNLNEVKINLYSSEVAGKLKINNFNQYFYQNCFFLLIILAILLLAYLLSQFLEFNKVQRFIKWNGVIAYQFIFSNYTYISIFHAFQVDTPGESRDDFDLVLASFVLLYQIGFLIYQGGRLNINYSQEQEQIEEEEVENQEIENNNSISLLKRNIKQDTIWKRNYWIFYEIRKIINCLLIIITKGHQGGIWTLMFINLIFLIYIVVIKPFKTSLYQKLSIYNEFVVTLIYAIFCFSISLSSNNGGLTFAYITSITVASNIFINIIFSFYFIYRRIYPNQEDIMSKSLNEEFNKSSVTKKEAEMINFNQQLSSISSIENNQDKSFSTNNNNNNKKLFRSAVSINHYTVRNQNFLNT